MTPERRPYLFSSSSRALCPGPLVQLSCEMQPVRQRTAPPAPAAARGRPGTRPGMTAGKWVGVALATATLAACGPAKTPAAPPPPQAVEAVAVSAPRASGGV